MTHGYSATLRLFSPIAGALVLVGACSGRSIRNDESGDSVERGGSAGTIDRGGSSGVAGTIDRGGTSGTGGTITGGASGTGGVTCDIGLGPVGSFEPRRTIPFSLTVGGQGGAGGQAGDVELSGSGGAGDEPSGCQTIPSGYECHGEVEATAARGRLVLQFDDGSTLTWTGAAGTFVAPPAVELGDVVWVDYRHEERSTCLLCRWDTETNLEISYLGRTLWLGREGTLLDEMDAAVVERLFRLTPRRDYVCTVPFSNGCFTYERELYDHWFETNPPQRIPHAIPTHVETPGGVYDVMWASSEQIETSTLGGCDGAPTVRDRGFAVSLIYP